VIEYRTGPRSCGVANRTVSGESGRSVIRIGGSGVVLCMAAIAISGSPGKLTVDVTKRTSNVYVRAGQREFCKCIVIEIRISPRCRGVADGAIGWESGLCVIRVGGPGVVLCVAAITISRRAREFSVDVAERTGNGHVGAGQREWSFRMVKNGSCPTRRVVAAYAGCGESSLNMIRIRCPLIVFGVARVTIGRSACELSVDMA
jgi:hypothetical protein